VDHVAHGDIKPDNIMFAEDLSLKFIDLGHAALMGTNMKRAIGTPDYKAPEVSRYFPFLIDKTDIFSLACTLFTIMF
jgi:serine/threonine protein kinase